MAKKWYLVGPMTSCYYKGGIWRNSAKRMLECIDPYEQESNVRPPLPHKNLFEFYNSLRAAHHLDRLRKAFRTILGINDKSVRAAFGLLCYEPYPQEVSSWGTIREVSLAFDLGKPIVIWSGVPLERMNFTAIAMSSAIVPTLTEAVAVCKSLEG